jgi:flagellin
MSSILTNNGAMVALQTLKGINSNLAKTQSEIATGKSIATSKDNAAVWAISKVMEADVEGFKAVSDNLGLGESTVATARTASEFIVTNLTKMKTLIAGAQGKSDDSRATIQKDIADLRDSIASTVAGAQFAGLNILNNRDLEAGSGSIDVLSSLDRAMTGVTVSNITVRKQDLSTAEQVIGTTAVGTLADYVTGTGAAVTGASTDADRTMTFLGGVVEAGIGYRVTLSAAAGNATVGDGAGGSSPSAGVYEYVARDGDTGADVARALAAMINGADADAVTAVAGTPNADGDATLRLDFADAADGVTFAFEAFESTGAEIGGGLEKLRTLDVTTVDGAKQALADIEGLLTTAIAASAAFGSAGSRIETQQKFVSNLMDSLKSGIGTLVDADMEEASARLQALQVQQQLGVQALSIANQAPQSLLSLFR